MAQLPHVWIDRGGTFSDCLFRDPETGRLVPLKLLSTDDAPIEAVRRLVGLTVDGQPKPCDLRLGTTLATNALLEAQGTSTVFVTNTGFEDLLHIDDQSRPGLFDPCPRRPTPLPKEVLGIEGRVCTKGSPIVALDPNAVRRGLREAWEKGCRAVGVALIHSVAHPEMERRVGAIAREVGFEDVSLSHELSSALGLLGRAQTAVLDAYLTAPLRQYLAHLRLHLPGTRIRIMRSDGSIVAAEDARACDLVLSGPAGGLVAAAEFATAEGLGSVLTFDMGGTSTDVARVSERPEITLDAKVAGHRVRRPMVAMHTIAAGGGSVCRWRDGRLWVGPESAGAHPGPLCFGHPDAVELTLTDVAVAVGRIHPEAFAGGVTVDRALAEQGLRRLAKSAGMSPDACARGLLQLASEAMAGALAEVSIAEGYDPRDHPLLIFGGAAGQYACEVADALGIDRIFVHPLGSVFSALGIGRAPVRQRRSQVFPQGLGIDDASLGIAFDSLGGAKGRRLVRARYVGAEQSLVLPFEAGHALQERFEEAWERRFGHRRGSAVEVVQVEVVWDSDDGSFPEVAVEPLGSASQQGLCGPQSVAMFGSSVFLGEAWRTVPRSDGMVELRRGDTKGSATLPTKRANLALERSLYAQRFEGIARQMGEVLRRSAGSTNMRERLDYSCAIFDTEGRLVANAPHIPVHLGSMGASVRAVLDAVASRGDGWSEGDAYAVNDPTAGGSHLPDITVVSPVFLDEAQPWAFVASRGHHADVGGTAPGSMPADATHLTEEGVVFRSLCVRRRGSLQESAIFDALASGEYPARAPKENLADLRAQLAANDRGVSLLQGLASQRGTEAVLGAMGSLRRLAREVVQNVIARLGERQGFGDRLDDGTPIQVELLRERRCERWSLVVDFAGSGPEHPGNLNAPPAVTTAALLYVLRLVAGRSIPLNDGALEDIELRLPEGILRPSATAAVAAGNVETSQRIVDVLLGAFGGFAASQGTMNNVALGNGTFGYYETLAGGIGAVEGHAGGHALHSHMTNSRITDPEILELRHPLRVRRFALRHRSGGDGRWAGGDGLHRELEALEELTVNLLSERRERPPYGQNGGSPGAPGRNFVRRRGGRVEELPGRAQIKLSAGDVLGISTPGGGGFGAP